MTAKKDPTRIVRRTRNWTRIYTGGEGTPPGPRCQFQLGEQVTVTTWSSQHSWNGSGDGSAKLEKWARVHRTGRIVGYRRVRVYYSEGGPFLGSYGFYMVKLDSGKVLMRVPAEWLEGAK